MFAVVATRPNSVHEFANASELVTYLAGVDAFAAVDVTPHHHHFHVTISHAPTLVNVNTEAHAHALAEIFRKAGYHDVSTEGVEDTESDIPSVIDSFLDSVINSMLRKDDGK